MTRQITIGIGIVMTAALGFANAQTPQTPQTQTPQTSSAAMQKEMKMTLSGCLQASPAGGEGFILTDARPTTSDRPTGTAGAGAGGASSASSASGAKAATYRLNVPASVNLRAHVGHKVEVTGTTADATMRTPGSTGTSSQPGTQDRSRTTTEQPRTTTEQPRTTTEQPRTTNEQPRTTNEQARTNTQQNTAEVRFNVDSVKMVAASCQ